MEAQSLDCISALVSRLELCYFQHRQGYIFYKLSFFHCSGCSNIKYLVLEMTVEYMAEEKHFLFFLMKQVSICCLQFAYWKQLYIWLKENWLVFRGITIVFVLYVHFSLSMSCFMVITSASALSALMSGELWQTATQP